MVRSRVQAGVGQPAAPVTRSPSRRDSGKRKYSPTQGEITSTGYRCPRYDDVLARTIPLHSDHEEDRVPPSANVTALSATDEAEIGGGGDGGGA
ncbi:predicted protein [Streptomyces viridosporus ATCC 14672]|uniref:Predicted protein n=1 Tax=Streptomyces viridosporus (strain ATCC 14672 / DSM 40746 / JCM 4963 / KCTC 9882 / NRRL B-12104 / FH 1290) TaxID=566461 RepID=D6A5J0_STRV1|nr:predicted protein [Streptomyces viridosporus ATCC 14672]